MRLVDADELLNNIKVEFGYLTEDNLILVPMRDVYKSIREAKTVSDKYAWHDLRKNPNDLPKDGEVVFCQHLPKLITDKKNLIVQHKFIDGRFVGNWDIDTNISSKTFGQRYYGDIIAWLEIEPFEEKRYCLEENK